MMQVNDYTETDFKETAIGVIPADWDVVKVNDVVTFTRKPRDLSISSFNAIPFIPMELIPDEGIYADKYVLKSPEEISSGTYCETGDLLLAKITPSFENGKQGIAYDLPLDFSYATTEVIAIKPIRHMLDTLFLFDFFKQDHVRADIAGRMEGTTGRQRVPKTVVENYLLPLPPLPEQRRIAAVLNAIQDEIAAQDDIITEVREFKRSLMHRLFTYGAGAEPAETKETEIGEIPAHWSIEQLQDLVTAMQNGLYKHGDFYGAGTLILRIDAFDPGDTVNDRLPLKRLTLTEDELKRYSLSSGDLVINRVNGNIELVGKPALIGLLSEPLVFESNMIRVRVDEEKVSSEFLLQYLCTEKARALIRQRARLVHQASLNQQDLNAFPVPYPPLEEQETIAELLQTVVDKIALEEDRKVALQDFFKTMLHQLMTGQIRLLSDDGLPL